MNNTFDIKKVLLFVVPGVVIVITIVVALMYAPNLMNPVNTLEGSGNAATSEKKISNIRSIDINVPGTVKIVASDEDRKLIINQKACNGQQTYQFKPKAGISITIKSPNIERIALSSSAEITAETKETKEFEIFHTGSGSITSGVNTDKLNVRLSGSGKIALTGRGFEQSIEVTGAGTFDGQNLSGNVGSVLMNSTGNVLINTSEVLTIKGSGSGTIYYIGAPSITRTISGPVKVQPYSGK